MVTLESGDGVERIALHGPGLDVAVIAVADIPATFDGKVRHNVANALAAAALAQGLGVAPETIAQGLASFTASLEHSQGRFNFVDDLPVRTLFDFAANPPAIRAMVRALEQFPVAGRRIRARAG